MMKHALPLVVCLLAACGDDGATSDGGGGTGATASTADATATTSTTSSSTTSGGSGGAEPGACAEVIGAFQDEACGSCATSACCDVIAECQADPACSEIFGCNAACGHDQACFEACYLAHADRFPAQLPVVECMIDACPEACAPTCESFYAPPFSADRAACAACIQGDCCEVFAEQLTPPSIDWLQCTQGCLDALCLRDCELAHPEGVAINDAIGECLFSQPCGASCLPPEGQAVCGGFGSSADPACVTCARDTCCAEQEACGFDTSCVDALICVSSCFDRASCGACYDAWPAETLGTALAVEGCAIAGCDSECSTDGCGFVKHLTSLACETCTRDACCAEQGACTDDAACAGLLVCTTVCDGESSCIDECEDRFPTAIAEHDALRACRASSCAEECGP